MLFRSALVNQAEATKQTFTDAMDDDFNSSEALAALFELVRFINTSRDAGAKDEQLAPAQAILRTLAGVLGLRLAEKKAKVKDIDENWIIEKINQRQEARARKDWSTSDSIRDELLEKGIKLEDTKDGTTWHW